MPKIANDNVDPVKAGTVTEGKPCPICRKPAQPEFRPFCSRRCADIDLHRWLGGVYRVPIADDDGREDQPSAGTEPE